ncbi:MAG: hypothetical protein A2X36_14625 [Elusimicrobia bacterium GWA2_69_24]|nr:MAG: hypothetical protein A2X36_14625 [Elusimicrobia bacterium GWA2_69_24]
MEGVAPLLPPAPPPAAFRAVVPERPPAAAPAASAGWDKVLSLYSRHWNELVEAPFLTAEGAPAEENLRKFRHLMRDKRTGGEIDVPVDLLNLLQEIQEHFHGAQIEIVCGYRSPKTNAALRRRNLTAARNSLHMKDWAADIRLHGIPIDAVHQFALSLRAGGVGFYPRQGFIHVDIGEVRRWVVGRRAAPVKRRRQRRR